MLREDSSGGTKNSTWLVFVISLHSEAHTDVLTFFSPFLQNMYSTLL